LPRLASSTARVSAATFRVQILRRRQLGFVVLSVHERLAQLRRQSHSGRGETAADTSSAALPASAAPALVAGKVQCQCNVANQDHLIAVLAIELNENILPGETVFGSSIHDGIRDDIYTHHRN